MSPSLKPLITLVGIVVPSIRSVSSVPPEVNAIEPSLAAPPSSSVELAPIVAEPTKVPVMSSVPPPDMDTASLPSPAVMVLSPSPLMVMLSVPDPAVIVLLPSPLIVMNSVPAPSTM